jgi:hypothetical protein
MKFLQMFHLWFDIIESAQETNFPFGQARSEVEAWARNDTAYGQIGFQIAVMSKLGAADLLQRSESCVCHV